MRSGPAAYKFILACIYDLAKKLAYTHFPFSCEIIVFAGRSRWDAGKFQYVPTQRLCFILFTRSLCVRECVRLFTKKHLCHRRLLDFPDKKSGRDIHRSLKKSAHEIRGLVLSDIHFSAA